MFTISVFYTSIIGLQPPRNRKRNLINFIAGLFLILSLGLFQLPTLAQIDLAIIQEIIDGDQVFIQENQAKVEDKAEFGQVVVTKDSRAGVIFNNGASGRMDTNSQITVGQCVEIQQGKILVSGPINGCIAGFTVGVQGTIYILETTDGKTGDIKVLEGTVEVTLADQTGEPIKITEGQKLPILQGILSQVFSMTSEEISSILLGKLFTGFNIPVTPEGALSSVCSRLLPGFTCSQNGIPTPSIPTPPIPRLPF
ncbi:hypothetical protein [Planktothrix agardhii]|jgi:hypothetical protein|uniref:hypothetical protein n=1 Tax=Planktothrix agardhii TaxID=1160 RepID=UPI00041E9329|nr:hypothetical protein [Planktothrix agardhii]CAD0227984.1 conserved hypothetical protein [Planktothrix agardhii]CAD5972365.1 hypothetical protein NO108_04240 [Planktothrix rubescens]CAH2574456.1 hypothetical protein PRNO82_03816 [Planktothrix rubescens]